MPSHRCVKYNSCCGIRNNSLFDAFGSTLAADGALEDGAAEGGGAATGPLDRGAERVDRRELLLDARDDPALIVEWRGLPGWDSTTMSGLSQASDQCRNPTPTGRLQLAVDRRASWVARLHGSDDSHLAHDPPTAPPNGAPDLRRAASGLLRRGVVRRRLLRDVRTLRGRDLDGPLRLRTEVAATLLARVQVVHGLSSPSDTNSMKSTSSQRMRSAVPSSTGRSSAS